MSEPGGLIGEFECRVDAKHRIALPADLLRQLEGADREQFVLNRGMDGQLVLHLQSEWRRVQEKLRTLNTYMEKDRRFARMYSAAYPVSPDAQNRLLLPRRFLDYARIKTDIVLVAMGGTIEVWNQTLYDQQFEDVREYSKLAEEVLGDRLVIPLGDER